MKACSSNRYRNRWIFSFIIIALLVVPVFTEAQNVTFEAESGATWFSQNDVRIPNDGGTQFDMLNLIGTGAEPYLRLRLNVELGQRHNLRLLYAPFQKSGTGTFNEEVFFEETTFQSGIVTEGIYKFNTYRLTYRYSLYEDNSWTFGAGVAALIRDAKVELRQDDRSDNNTDLGFVPLLHVYAGHKFSDKVSVSLDAEGLGASQGRAFDVALQADYNLTDQINLFTGYRVLEGGADVEEVYNFSWINFVSVGVRYNI